VAYFGPQSDLLVEIRYPYYDRDFLEFVYAIPREQIVRVGQRRSLMKRALLGIVPDELLKRRRKTFIPPEPKKDSSTEWPSLVEIGQHIRSSSVGIVDRDRFAEALQKARHNEDVPIGSLKRVVTLESWLRHLTIQGVLTDSTPSEKQTNSTTLGTQQLQASSQPKSLAT
jgi:asparagine synthase (glutamine-hydrolysing)